MLKSTPFKYFFSSYSSLFTLHSSRLGIVLALATLLSPNIGIGGLLGLVFAIFYLAIFKSSIHEAVIKSILRNCLLIGLLIGDLFAFNFYILVFLAFFIFLTLVFTTALEYLFSKPYLPTLSLPFCFVGLIIFTLLPQIYHFTHIPIDRWNIDISHFLPKFFTYFFHSLSSLLLSTNATLGAIFWLMIVLTSPLNAIFLFLGFIIGINFELLLHINTPNLSFYSNYLNHSLIFAAIAGVFLTPSPLSILIAIIATLSTSIITIISSKILNSFYLPILSLPFNIVVLMFILSLRIIRPSLLNSILPKSPEENLINSESAKNHFNSDEIGVFLPVKGSWKIQQAFDGELTHRGPWQYGLDFVACNQYDKTIKNEGLELTDHLSFEADIYSPIDGWVIDCVDSNKDNNIGEVDNNNTWGNYIILKTYQGVFVSLLHLQQGSIIVTPGSFVKAGQKLARCGNSGYSPEPHLHLQVQNQPLPGSKTIAFNLLNYAIDNKIYFNHIPKKNDIVRSINPNLISEKAFNFKIGEKLTFKCNDKTIVTIENQMDEVSGGFYLSDGVSKIYYSKTGINFHFYRFEGKKHSAIFNLAVAASNIPLIYGEEFQYLGQLPLSLMSEFLSKFFGFFKKSFGFKIKNNGSNYIISKDGLNVTGTHIFTSQKIFSTFKIDPLLGIKEFRVGTKEYHRIK